MQEGVGVGYYLCGFYQGCVYGLGYFYSIVEGVSDGYVVVIGYGSQEIVISYIQGKEEVYLGQVVSQGDGVVMG